MEAHTHEYIATAHDDQKFGFSIGGGDASQAIQAVAAHPSLELRGLHSHIGSQIFDTAGFEVAVRRVLALHARCLSAGLSLPELNVGGGFGIAYTTQDDPAPPAALAAGIGSIIGRECRALGIDIPRLAIEPGRAIAGPSTFTLYTVGTVKRVQLDGGLEPAVRRCRRRHERQPPRGALWRGLLLHTRVPRVTCGPGVVASGGQALRGR